MTGGSGLGAKMDVVVGTGGSVIDFKIADRGIGYKVGDVLSLEGLPFNPVGVGSTAFQITVVNKYQDKFAGWTFGQLLELDDFSEQFNGARTSFLITRTIATKEYYSIVAQDGSGIVLANNLLIFLNDVLQKPDLDMSSRVVQESRLRKHQKQEVSLRFIFILVLIMIMCRLMLMKQSNRVIN